MSVRKDQIAWWIIIIGVLVVLFVAISYIISLSRPTTSVRLGDGVFQAKLALTPAEQQKGLGGVTSMKQSEAMLFVFDHDGNHPIHMKDMQIPIDAVWLDRNKVVVHIVRNITPETYPQTYESKKPARYLIELAAGTATDRRITIGSTATFDLEE